MISRVKTNIVANLAGSTWTTLLAIIVVPFYLKFLGIEAYGLVGFYAVMQGVLSVFDLGLTPSINREMAKHLTLQGQEQNMADLFRTLEILYWAMAAVVGLSVLCCAPWIAGKWLNAGDMPQSSVNQTVFLMGLSIWITWPLGFYSGGLLGLQRQVLYNTVNAAGLSLRSLGAIVVLWWISPTIQAFFLWQIGVGAVHVGVLALCMWRSLPRGVKPCFRPSMLKDIWRFSSGCFGNATTQMIMAQMDKIVLSRFLSLEFFGYYSLASLIAGTLNRAVAPISTALFPRFTQMITRNDHPGLEQLYRASCQMVAVLTLPLMSVLMLFSPTILALWTGDSAVVSGTHKILTILVVGAAANNIMTLPAVLSSSDGRPLLLFWLQVLGILIVLPLMIFLTIHHGAMGAAVTRVSCDIVTLLVFPFLLHRRILSGAKADWFRYSVILPVLSSLATVMAFRLLFDRLALSGAESLLFIVTAFFVALATTFVVVKHFRRALLAMLSFRQVAG